jgi:hypothetical protein
LCGTNIHAGGTFLPFVFRILPLELDEKTMRWLELSEIEG